MGTYPQVLGLVSEDDKGFSACTVAVINQCILGAAHCFIPQRKTNYVVVPPANQKINVDLKTLKKSNDNTDVSDIAVAKLAEPVEDYFPT